MNYRFRLLHIGLLLGWAGYAQAQQAPLVLTVQSAEGALQHWRIAEGSVTMSTVMNNGPEQHTVEYTPMLSARQLLTVVNTPQGRFQSNMPVLGRVNYDELSVDSFDRSGTIPQLYYVYQGVKYRAEVDLSVPFEATLYADYFPGEVPVLALARRGIEGFARKVVRTDTGQVVWQVVPTPAAPARKG